MSAAGMPSALVAQQSLVWKGGAQPFWVWAAALGAAALAGAALSVFLSRRRDRKLFEGVLSSRDDGVLVVRRGVPVRFNEAMSAMTGYTAKEFSHLCVPEHLAAPGARVEFSDRLASDAASAFDATLRRKDGSHFTARVSLTPGGALGGGRRLIFFRDTSYAQQLDAALRRNEARMRSLWECTVESLVFHRDDLVDEVNLAFTETFGFARDEVVGRSFSETIVAPQDRARVRDHMRNRSLRTYEIRALRKDGIAITLEVQPREVTRDGETLRVAGLRDITARKRVESRFAKQLSLFRATFDATEEGLLVVDREGRIVSSNRRFAEMWNLSEGEIAAGDDARICLSVAEMLHDGEEFLRRVKELYAHPTESSTELLELRDGRIFERHSKPQVLYGAAVGRVWSFRDITARETARREADRQLSLNRATLEATSEGVLVVDTSGHVRSANRRFGELWNVSHTGLADAGRERLARVFEGRVAEPERFAAELLSAEDAAFELTDDIVLLADGCVYERHSQPQTLGGVTIGRVWSFHDITDRVKADRALRELNADLDRRVRDRTLELERVNTDLHESNTELEAFSYSVSHDLRAPLRGIDGFSLALVEEYGEQLDTVGRDYLRRVRGGVQRMGRIMDDLIHLSRVTRASMSYGEVDLTPLADEVIQQLREQHPARVVEFVRPDATLANGDRRLLRVLLENMIGNAWKYSSKKPEARIVFGYEDREGDIREFFVRDNGAGFDPAFKEKLFTTFSRLHGPQDFEGTGIGLAIVGRIVRRHGGTVFAEGVPGEGAVFGFRLPKRTVSVGE